MSSDPDDTPDSDAILARRAFLVRTALGAAGLAAAGAQAQTLPPPPEPQVCLKPMAPPDVVTLRYAPSNAKVKVLKGGYALCPTPQDEAVEGLCTIETKRGDRLRIRVSTDDAETIVEIAAVDGAEVYVEVKAPQEKPAPQICLSRVVPE